MKQKFNINQLEKRNPFTTPKGYFENLTERVMSQLPEEPRAEQSQTASQVVELKSHNRAAKRSRITWFLTTAAAACMAGAIFWITSSGPDIQNGTGSQTTQQALAQNNTNMQEDDYGYDEYSEEALSYALVDEADIYSYLSGAGM